MKNPFKFTKTKPTKVTYRHPFAEFSWKQPQAPPSLQKAQSTAPLPSPSPQAESEGSSWRDWLVTFGVVLVGTVAGFLAQYLPFGKAAVGVYAIVAVMLRIKSSTTFLLAFVSLLTVIALMIRGASQLANAFAFYTFCLIAIGTLGVFLEVKRNERQLRMGQRKTES